MQCKLWGNPSKSFKQILLFFVADLVHNVWTLKYNLQWFTVLYQLEMSRELSKINDQQYFFSIPPLTMLIIRWFSPLFVGKEKREIFQHWLGGKGDMQFSSSIPTTFVWDCLKEKYEEFSSAGNTRDCHDVTVFLTIEVDLGSVTYTFFLETAQNVSTLL